MKPLQRHLAAWVAGAFVVGVLTTVWVSPLAADSSRKTMSATRKTMGSTRTEMRSERRTGTSKLRRGSQSSNSTVRGGYSSTTRRESELKKDASGTLPPTTRESESPYAPPGARDWDDPYGELDGADADDGDPAADGRANRREERQREHREQTPGRSCILGAGGRVVYRPPGAVCAGDAAPSTASPQSADPFEAPAAGPRSGRVRTPTQKNSGCGGRCMYGPAGRVLYAPAGCDC